MKNLVEIKKDYKDRESKNFCQGTKKTRKEYQTETPVFKSKTGEWIIDEQEIKENVKKNTFRST